MMQVTKFKKINLCADAAERSVYRLSPNAFGAGYLNPENCQRFNLTAAV